MLKYGTQNSLQTKESHYNMKIRWVSSNWILKNHASEMQRFTTKFLGKMYILNRSNHARLRSNSIFFLRTAMLQFGYCYANIIVWYTRSRSWIIQIVNSDQCSGHKTGLSVKIQQRIKYILEKKIFLKNSSHELKCYNLWDFNALLTRSAA